MQGRKVVIEQLVALIHAADSAVVVTHIGPDGDAIGSQLAMGRLLERLGKTVTMYNVDPPARNLEWLPGAERVEIFDGSMDQRQKLADADVIFVLDTNSANRLGDMAAPIRNSGTRTVLVDHHPDPEDWFDMRYVRDDASSTGELVYEIIDALDASLIDRDIAASLYAAIVTDTGSFRYSSVTSRVHRIVADLLERGGIEPEPIHVALYDTRSLSAIRLLAEALGTITLRFGGEVAFMVVTNEMLERAEADRDDTEGLVNMLLSIEGVRVGLFFLETAKGTKVSFRSQGDDNVHRWARAFDGGGHRNASGAFVQKDLDEAVNRVVGAAPRFIDLETSEDKDPSVSDDDAAYLASLFRAGSSK